MIININITHHSSTHLHPMVVINYPYIPSHSSSSSSSTGFCLLASAFSLSSFAKSLRSSGHVPLSLSQGRTHSRSKRCVG